MRKILLGKNCKVDKLAKVGIKSDRIRNSSIYLKIGNNAVIRSNTIIYSGSTIGDNLQTGHNVIIREENTIGNNFKIWSNSIIDYGCKIGNNVKVHSGCYIAQYSTIEDGVFIAPGVVFANDLHPGCKFSDKCLKGPTIKKNVRIGCNSTILPYVTVGENSVIGAGSVVVKDIPKNSVAYGNPAVVYCLIYELKCKRGFTEKPYPK